MTDAQKLLVKLLKNPEFREAWEEPAPEFDAIKMVYDKKPLSEIMDVTGLDKEFILEVAKKRKIEFSE